MLAKVSRVTWNGHVLKGDEDDALRKALNFKVETGVRVGENRDEDMEKATMRED